MRSSTLWIAVLLGTTCSGVARADDALPEWPGTTADAATASGTLLSLGMRYRTSERSALFADAYGVRGVGTHGRDAMLRKVGVEFKTAQSQLSVAYGDLGWSFAGDTRMSVRVRKGGFGLYMRGKF
jgi:hypothetical protein